jgi:hypothetical protein
VLRLFLALLVGPLGALTSAALAQPGRSDSLAADSLAAGELGVALAGPIAEAWLPEGRPRRAEALKRARRARLDSLRSPERGGLEAFLLAHEDVLAGGESNGPSRFYLVLGGAGEAAPIAGGLGVRLLPGHAERMLNVQVAASLRGSIVGLAEAGVPAGPVGLRVAGRAARYNEERFFGLGAEADAAHARYEVREGAVEALAAVRPLRPLRFAATAGYRAYSPHADDLAPGLPGADSDPTYAVLGLRLAYDSRDGGAGEPLWFGSRDTPGGSGNPWRGFYAAVAAERFEEAGNEPLSFTRYDVELQAFVSFRYGYQRLALRHRTVYADPDGGAAVPFYLQPALGGAYALRGFAPFRFRDRGTLLFGAEYRWRVWRFLDLALFVDAGRAFHRLDDWGARDLEVGYGGGLRFATRADVLLRLDLAHSREGARLSAAFTAPF